MWMECLEIESYLQRAVKSGPFRAEPFFQLGAAERRLILGLQRARVLLGSCEAASHEAARVVLWLWIHPTAMNLWCF